MRLLLWVVIGIIVVAWLMRLAKTPGPSTSGRPGKRQQERSAKGEPMVPCAHCGTHIPLSESLRDAKGIPYCSEEHKRLHA